MVYAHACVFCIITCIEQDGMPAMRANPGARVTKSTLTPRQTNMYSLNARPSFDEPEMNETKA